MPLSPRTQSMMQQEQAGTPDELFEAAFQDMAMNQLVTRNPEIAEQVATLKVLEADAENNSATGTFIIPRGEGEIHIPVILSENEIMPFDTMYVTSLDMMLPLNDDWLGEVDRTDMAEFGEAVETPDDLATDVDIRNVVVPPTTGRYAYASAGKLLPAYLTRASNQVKTAFVDTLQRYPHIAKRAFEIYGVNTLGDAVRPHRPKVATTTAEISFVTIETPESTTKELFGERSPEAMSEIANKGYSIAGTQADPALLVSTERPLELEVPGSPGFYRLFMTDGKQRGALVFTSVLTAQGLRYGNRAQVSTPYGMHDQNNETTRVALTEDGEMFLSNKDFMAQHLDTQEIPSGLESKITKSQGGTPRNGQRGVFFDPNHKNLVAFEPIKIDMVRNSGDSKYIYGKTYLGDRVLLVQIKGSPVSAPKAFVGGQGPNGRDERETVPYSFQTQAERKKDEPFGVETTVLIPNHWRFCAADSIISPNQVLKDPEAVTSMYYDALTLSGAERVRLKDAQANQIYCEGESRSKMATLQYLVQKYNARIEDAEEMIEKTASEGRADFMVLSPAARHRFAARIKLAQGPGMMAQGPPPQGPPMQGPPPEAGGAPPMQGPPPEMMIDPATGMPIDPATGMPMDPAMMGMPMDPAMMGPPPPPPPSPVEMAAQEVASELMEVNDQLMQQLAMQQQNVQTQLGAIQAVVERANQISAETGLPAPQMPSLMPPPEMVDPAMMGPEVPPGAQGMPVEEPGMMESAMELEDPELFDSAALASMAQTNNFDSTVSSFTPQLRETLDAIGRMLTEVRMKGPDLRERLGDSTYQEIRDSLENLFTDLGESLTRLNSFTTSEPQA